jgi:proteasome lid subunit RPN8/RPN11
LTDILQVRLRRDVRAAIIAHARREAPNECCGLLIGRELLIDEAVPARNLCASPTRYLLDPADHIATNRRLRHTSRSVMGAYHSHPSSPPVPSETDSTEAFYHEFVWMIVSLVEPGGEVAAFKLTNGELTPVGLLLES